MKGIYKTKEGQKVEVLDFDEANKIAMISVDGLQNKWVDEKEYSTWEKEGEEETEEPEPTIEVEEIEPQVVDEPIIEEQLSEETTSGIEYNPITEEPKRRKRTPVKKETKPKKK